MATHKSAAVLSGIMPDHALAGNVHFRHGYFTTADDDMVSGETIEMLPIPQGARILELMVRCDTVLTGGTGTEIGDGDSNARFYNALTMAAAMYARFGETKYGFVESGVGYKYAQDDTIDIYLKKTSTKVPTAATFDLWVLYNITGTINDEQ